MSGTFRCVHRWAEIRRDRRQARERLAVDADLVAAQALWRLNRIARRVGLGMAGTNIYALKAPFIRVLYERRGARVERHVQELPCWGYGAWGCEGPDCEKCGGSGVWRRHRLYCFTFEIDSQPFTWHQPESLVNYPVTVEGEERAYRAVDVLSRPAVVPANVNRDVAVLYEYLRAAGVAARVLDYDRGLWGCLRSDLERWFINTRPAKAVYRRWYRLREGVLDRWYAWRFTPATEPYMPPEDDSDLPF